MPDRPRATNRIDQQEAADGGYLTPLALARYMRLTTFNRDGMPVSASVHGMVDGDRAYFRARSQSGTVKRLQYTDAVQVTPCGVLGFWTYGPLLSAVARQLRDEEASRVAVELDRRYPVRHRFLIRLLRRQAAYYELVADEAAGDQGALPGGLPASLVTRVQTSQGFMHPNAATPTSLATICTPSMMSCSCLSDCTQITTVSMSLPTLWPAAEAQEDHGAALAPEDSHTP
jgi:uncharacterized protein